MPPEPADRTSVRRLAERVAHTLRFRIVRASRRATRTAVQWTTTVRRGLWDAAGLPGAPTNIWPLQDRWPSGDVITQGSPTPLTCRVIPLPAPARLARWLWGKDSVGLDGGALPDNRLLLAVGPASPTPHSASEDRFTLDQLPTLLSARHSTAGTPPPHTVLLVPASLAGRAREVVRSANCANGLWIVIDDGPRRRVDVLSLVSAVAVPPAAASQLSIRGLVAEAAAAGRPTLPWPADEPLPPRLESSELLRVSGRQARLDLVRSLGEAGQTTVSPPLPAPSARVLHEPRRVVVAGHDLKFAHGIIHELRARGHHVRTDDWAGHERHDVAASRALTEWADVAFCEWTLGNADWYSRHLGADRRLVTRLHLQEAATPFPTRMQQDRVDAVVFVAEHIRQQVVRDHGLSEHRTLVVPNAVETVPAPEKNPSDRFRLGLVGMVPRRKGLHVALDTLALLRAEDPRYTLTLRGHRPEDYAWMAGRSSEAQYYRDTLERLSTDPLLAGAVSFSPHGPEMSAWYAELGVVLSTSDFESFHFSLPDGAMGLAIPRSLAWPGADVLYPAAWLAPDAAGLAASIRSATSTADTWQREANDARLFVQEHYAAEVVLPRLAEVILGT